MRGELFTKSDQEFNLDSTDMNPDATDMRRERYHSVIRNNFGQMGSCWPLCLLCHYVKLQECLSPCFVTMFCF